MVTVARELKAEEMVLQGRTKCQTLRFFRFTS